MVVTLDSWLKDIRVQLSSVRRFVCCSAGAVQCGTIQERAKSVSSRMMILQQVESAKEAYGREDRTVAGQIMVGLYVSGRRSDGLRIDRESIGTSPAKVKVSVVYIGG